MALRAICRGRKFINCSSGFGKIFTSSKDFGVASGRDDVFLNDSQIRSRAFQSFVHNHRVESNSFLSNCLQENGLSNPYTTSKFFVHKPNRHYRVEPMSSNQHATKDYKLLFAHKLLESYPLRSLLRAMALSNLSCLVGPVYAAEAWRGAGVLSVISKSVRLNEERLLALGKVSYLGLMVSGLKSVVASILTVDGIGGLATAFAAKDILNNALSGLSLHHSKPLSLGHIVKPPFQMNPFSTTSLKKKEKKKKETLKKEYYSWDPPKDGWYKANCDGSYFNGKERDGTFNVANMWSSQGVIIRDSNGVEVKSINCTVTGSEVTGDSYDSEFRAIILGLEFALECGITKIIIESDALHILDALKFGTTMQRVEFSEYKKQIVALVEQFEEVDFNFNIRECNRAANIIGSLALGQRVVIKASTDITDMEKFESFLEALRDDIAGSVQIGKTQLRSTLFS